jgi:hypothetical protein
MDCLNCGAVKTKWSRLCFMCADDVNREIRNGNQRRKSAMTEWKGFIGQHGSRLFDGLAEECKRLGLGFENDVIQWPGEYTDEQMEFAGEYGLIADAQGALELLDQVGVEGLPKNKPLPKPAEIELLPIEQVIALCGASPIEDAPAPVESIRRF